MWEVYCHSQTNKVEFTVLTGHQNSLHCITIQYSIAYLKLFFIKIWSESLYSRQFASQEVIKSEVIMQEA